MSDVADVRRWLSEGSALTARLPDFAEREGQLSMAQDIAEIVVHGGTLACEAGTGTGKTLAYLVPLLAIGRRAIISTGTRNLQDQLYFRDLPLVREAMGARVTTAKAALAVCGLHWMNVLLLALLPDAATRSCRPCEAENPSAWINTRCAPGEAGLSGHSPGIHFGSSQSANASRSIPPPLMFCHFNT